MFACNLSRLWLLTVEPMMKSIQSGTVMVAYTNSKQARGLRDRGVRERGRDANGCDQSTHVVRLLLTTINLAAPTRSKQ